MTENCVLREKVNAVEVEIIARDEPRRIGTSKATVRLNSVASVAGNRYGQQPSDDA
ncbi:hypothetical protein [Aldersonia kunmingensis]|uniref:hypothetical protein n=1 Tax=Aldersonia kunmingensis TaxID=408066 RepID=UPI000A800789|nr:hypothetical protein [Aldersonia kunmingensis]